MTVFNHQIQLDLDQNTKIAESASRSFQLANAASHHVNHGPNCGTFAQGAAHYHDTPSLATIDKRSASTDPNVLTEVSSTDSIGDCLSDDQEQAVSSDISHSRFQPTKFLKTSVSTDSVLRVSEWQPINAPRFMDTCEGLARTTIGQRSVEEGTYGENDSEAISINNDDYQENQENIEDVEAQILAEDTTDPSFDDKYFDHYGYLNYINSPYGETSSAKDENKVSPSRKQKTAKSATKCKKRNSGGEPKVPEDACANTETEVDYSASQTFESSPSDDNIQSDLTGHWKLRSGTTEPPQIGLRSPEKLTISLFHTLTNSMKIFKFPTTTLMQYAMDWKSRTHINLITQWRASIFSKYDIPLKKFPSPYTEEENAWFDLFHAKLRAVTEDGIAIKLPGPVPVMEAFNSFFAGSSSENVNKEGTVNSGKEARSYVSIRCKLEKKKSKLGEERAQLRSLIGNTKDGVLYVPVFDARELAAYRKDGKVILDDPYAEEKNAAFRGAKEKNNKGSPKRRSTNVQDGESSETGKDSKRVKV